MAAAAGDTGNIKAGNPGSAPFNPGSATPGTGNAKTEAFIKTALSHLHEGNAAEAVRALENALRLDDEDAGTLYTLTCVNWCLEKTAAIRENDSPYDKAWYLSNQWEYYCRFLEKLPQTAAFPRSAAAAGQYLNSEALKFFNEVEQTGGLRHDPPLLLRTGVCYKRAGDYDTALEYIKKALSFMESGGEATAEYADVHALMGDERTAKLFFREAFFLDPEHIALYSLEARFIVSLIENIKALGVDRHLNEWLPVYGTLLGVFTVKRELKPAEAGKLKQSVFNLETELRGGTEDPARVIPLLLNKYLWLLDYYEITGAESALSAEVLMKIRLTAPAIYDRYIRA